MFSKPSACAILALSWLIACGDDGSEPEPPLFPANYRTSYQEVRNCRQSGDHDLNRVRILADEAAYGPYMDRDSDFPVGAVVLKEEYDFADSDCSGEIMQYTVMSRLEPGSSESMLDWRWQEVDARRRIVSENAPLCAGCHRACTAEAGGYLGTCAVP